MRSGSSVPVSAVESTMSQNMTVSWRRSAGASAAARSADPGSTSCMVPVTATAAISLRRWPSDRPSSLRSASERRRKAAMSTSFAANAGLYRCKLKVSSKWVSSSIGVSRPRLSFVSNSGSSEASFECRCLNDAAQPCGGRKPIHCHVPDAYLRAVPSRKQLSQAERLQPIWPARCFAGRHGGGSGGSRQWTISLGTEDRASAWSAEIWSLLAAVTPLAALFVRWSRPVAQPLEAHAVHPASAPVHRNAHACLLQHARELRRGELAALVEVEDLRMAEPRQGFLQRLDAERHVHGVRHPPGRHLPARPVHHRNQIKKATPHRTSALPNLVGALRE